MAGKKGMKHYSREVKVEAIRLYFEEGWTQRQIADKLGVSSRKRIEGWVSQYRREGTAAFTRPKGRPRKTEDREAYVARLEMENALLKNIIPNCTGKGSRGAISGHLPLPRSLSGDSHV